MYFRDPNDDGHGPLIDPSTYDALSTSKGTSPIAKCNSLPQAVAALEARIAAQLARKAHVHTDADTQAGENGKSVSRAKLVFDRYDADKSGGLNRDEFNAMVKGLVPGDVDPKAVRAVMKKVDRDGSGRIEFREFEWLIKREHRAANRRHDAQVRRRRAGAAAGAL